MAPASEVRLWLFLTLLAGFSWMTASAVGAEKPVLVHYMPWFEGKPHSREWGFHWTMNACDPEVTDKSGLRQIASHYHPLIGPYDSADPVVLEYHFLLMKLAGIDGVIVDWYGMDPVHDYAINEARTLAVRDYARKAGLKFCLCYEDRTIQMAIDTGFILPADAISHGQQTMLHAQSNYFSDSSYLRLADGKPVLLNFGPQFYIDAAQWAALFSVLDPTNQPSLFTLNLRLSTGTGAFNWPPMHLSDTNSGTLSPAVLAGYLDNFEQTAGHWPAYISSAFPRFRDFYQQAGERTSYGYLGDDDGATFRSTLARAMTNDSVMVQLVTWNDFGEGTVIEPTLEYGYRDLGVVQELRRQHLDAGYAGRTDDLHLATRLFHLRRRHAANDDLTAELDRVFAAVVSGDLPLADMQLAALESTASLVHQAGATSKVLQPSVDDGLSQSGGEPRTTNLTSVGRTLVPIAVGTNTIGISTPMPEERAPALLGAQSIDP